MYLKFGFKNTQMKQIKLFLCGNNGNSQSLKNRINKNISMYFIDYQHQTHVQKLVHPFYSLYDFYVS